MRSRRRLRQTVSLSAGRAASSGSGTSDSDPWYWCELNPSAPAGASSPVSLCFGAAAWPLMLATSRTRRGASKTRAPGNQPTGMRPCSFDSRSAGSNATTATAFWVPFAT